MKKARIILAMVAMTIIPAFAVATMNESSSYALTPPAGGSCPKQTSFFDLPRWYDNLPLVLTQDGSSCTIALTSPNDLWIIVLNVINILLRLTGLVAVVFIIIGGIRYITSQGQAAGITSAKQTIVRAVTGLAISILAILIVTYVSSVFGRTVHPDNNYQVSIVGEYNV